MEKFSRLSSRCLFGVLAVWFAWMWTGEAIADCSTGELTAVFIVDDIYPLTAPQLSLLSVMPLGPPTEPSDAEMIAAIEAVQPGFAYTHANQAGPFHLYFADPVDYGACAIVDGRDARVVFAGTITWMGLGSVTRPYVSSHAWSFSAGDPAPPPISTEILPPFEWAPAYYGTPAEITSAVVDVLRQSDVLRSFGDCDAYSVVSFIYTPAVGMVDPGEARNVVIVSGRAGPPWSDLPTATPPIPGATWRVSVAPNPFNPRTMIRLEVPRSVQLLVSIHALDGRRVMELANREFAAGTHLLKWDGRDLSGRGVASGLYIARVESPDHTESRSLTLLR